MKEMLKYTPEDVERLKRQLEEKRGRKMVDKMTGEEVASRKEEIETNLEKEVDPTITERIKRGSVDARIERERTERENEEELPILRTKEKKELSPKEKRIKLEKLKEYLKDLERGKTPLIVEGIEEEEIEKIKAEIEKLGKELEEKN